MSLPRATLTLRPRKGATDLPLAALWLARVLWWCLAPLLVG
jgi:hypothetical protein